LICKAPETWKDVESVALAKVGKAQYGYFNAFYIGFCEFVWDHTGVRLPRIDTQQEICSEFIARVYGLQPAEISPIELYRMLEEKKES